MQSDNVVSKITEFIGEIEKAKIKCSKGVLKINDAERLITNIRQTLSELLPNKSDSYHIYKRYILENPLWWETTRGHGYVEKSTCSNLIKEKEILNKILLEIVPGIQENTESPDDAFHIHKQERSKAMHIIFNIMNRSKSSLMIIDSYIDQSLYTYIKSLNPNITFRILTNEDHLKPIFLQITKELQKEGWNIRVRSSSDYHDRYVIVDDKEIWSIGASIKDAGNKEHTIGKINDFEEMETINKGVKSNWNEAVKICDGPQYNVIKYRVDLQMPVYIKNNNEDDAKLEAKKLGDDWIKKVEKGLSEKLNIVSSDDYGSEYSLSSDGKSRIKLSWIHRGFHSKKYFISTDINVETTEISKLVKIIDAGKQTYWAIYYTLDTELDLDAIQGVMHKSSGDPGFVDDFSDEKKTKQRVNTLEYRSELGIIFQLHRGSSGQGRMTINYRKGGLDKGFKKAHKVFTPTKILSIFNGEIAPIALKKLIDNAS